MISDDFAPKSLIQLAFRRLRSNCQYASDHTLTPPIKTLAFNDNDWQAGTRGTSAYSNYTILSRQSARIVLSLGFLEQKRSTRPLAIEYLVAPLRTNTDRSPPFSRSTTDTELLAELLIAGNDLFRHSLFCETVDSIVGLNVLHPYSQRFEDLILRKGTPLNSSYTLSRDYLPQPFVPFLLDIPAQRYSRSIELACMLEQGMLSSLSHTY